MDRRYNENKGASDRTSRRSEALVRARLASARVGMRSTTADDWRGSTSRGESIENLARLNSARSSDRRERNERFELEGSGVLGAKPAFDDARRDARLGRGRLDLYL